MKRNFFYPNISQCDFQNPNIYAADVLYFVLENYEKYINQFSDIYALDESSWISLAINFGANVGSCVFN